MEAFTAEIASPRHGRWLEAIVLDLKDFHYTRRELDEMGIGLHSIAASRLNRRINGSASLRDIYEMGLADFLRQPGCGEVSAIVISHCIAAAGWDVFKWIGAKGRSMKGAMANAKANKPKSRIPGRTRASRNKG